MTAAALWMPRSVRSTNPTTIEAPPAVFAASASRAVRLSSTNDGRSTRSSGGYPEIGSSGKTTTSASASVARDAQAVRRSTLPGRSPTVVSTCPSAILTSVSLDGEGLLDPANVEVVGLPDQVRSELAMAHDLTEQPLEVVPGVVQRPFGSDGRGLKPGDQGLRALAPPGGFLRKRLDFL